MDAAIHAMKQFGFDDEAVIAKMHELLKEYGGQYGFIEIYSVLLEALLSNQDKENCKEENQEAAHGETSNASMQNEIVEGEMVEEGQPVVPTAGFIDIPLCSSAPFAAIPPPSPSPPPAQQLVASLSQSTPAVDEALPLPLPPQSLPASPPVVDAALPLSQPPPPVMDAALHLPPPPVLDADRPMPPPSPVMDAALQLPPPPVLDVYQPPPPPPPPPVMDADLQLPPPPVLDTDRPPPLPVMDAAIQLPPPPVLDADRPLNPAFGHQDKRQKPCYGQINEDDEVPQLIRLPSSLDGNISPPETPPSQRGLEEVTDGRKDCPRPRSRWNFRAEVSSRSVTGNQSHHPVSSSRYESQKRRDWNTFDKYLKNQSPPVSVSQCNCSHVLEFLRYLDQFGKTKVHLQGCVYFGQLYPLDPPCTCPLRQAWGSLDSMTGRLRAAFEENVGVSEKNPFGNREILVYLRQVKECQAKARGVSYEKKKRNKIKANDEANASKLQAT